MTYSVKWIPTNITFARRFDVYLDYPFFEHQVHAFISNLVSSFPVNMSPLVDLLLDKPQLFTFVFLLLYSEHCSLDKLRERRKNLE